MKFGKLSLSILGTQNGRGFDILYNFQKNHNFVEFTSKEVFHFIQPWMQFPSREYTDECKLVSIELVRRFNEFEELQARCEKLEKQLTAIFDKQRDEKYGR